MIIPSQPLSFSEPSPSLQKEEGGSVKSIPHHNADSDIWVPDHLTPSWVCLPNDKPVLSIIQTGETALDALEGICKVGGNFQNQGWNSDNVFP